MNTSPIEQIQKAVADQVENERQAYGSEPEYQLTELGNAERFADQHRDYARYVSQWKKWIFYDGKRWSPSADDQVRKLAHKTVKRFYADAVKESDIEKAKKLAQWGAASCRSSAISAMLKEASALLSIDPSVLDINQWLFNCDNVTIDIRTMTARPHNRLDYITKITPVIYDPHVGSPLYEKTLRRCLPESSISYLQRFFGYCLTGSTIEQMVNIWWGDGANGKTTILTPPTNVLGDYAQITRPETLMTKRNDGIPSDVAKLKGARFVVAAEGEDGHRLAESAIKQWTGGDKIQARALYQDWFEFIPEFKILLCTNHKPIIIGTDHAIWRRIRLVPFNVTIPDSEQDKNLPAKLNQELSGILNWMLAGAEKWLSEGLGCPDEVAEATANYQSEQSVINIFMEGCCIVRADAMVEAGMLFKHFDQWRTNEGHRKITQTKFGTMLTQLGFEKGRLPGLGRMFYRGIGINEH
jgi:putative DNA primase/helicase